MKTNHGMGKTFKIKFDVHQGSVSSPFLFVMEALTKDIRGLPWKILHADGLMPLAESVESLKMLVGKGKQTRVQNGRV